jgi:DNA helicase-2/ATP-dependent DNA helicase PcrA
MDGPTLVLAGAGAGKTRVLTERTAALVQTHHVLPERILVVTFTNKAAREMKARLSRLIGESAVQRLWIGTFHAVCGRLLRHDIQRLGYTPAFVIYDSEDQEKLLREVLTELGYDSRTARSWLRQISALKNKGLMVAAFRAGAHDFEQLALARIYARYQERLALSNALDFDDLLLLTLRLLEQEAELCQRWQAHFQYLLVDEYQDTNQVQFQLLRLLAQQHRNLFVVGDVDQSIYSFRHADFQIILGFQADYPEAQIIKLEHNYRSRAPILAAANTLIAHNRDRFDKVLIPTRTGGTPLQVCESSNEYLEADFVIRQVQKLLNAGVSPGEICILYRTNAQSRLFEEKLIQHQIPHQLIGAFRFYERKEVKDLIAYLRVLWNPLDDLSLKRILNTPRRGIGRKSQDKLEQLAEREGLSLWDTLNNPVLLSSSSAKIRTLLATFIGWLNSLRAQASSTSPAELLERIYQQSGYAAEIQQDDPLAAEERDGYIQSLIQAAREYSSLFPEGSMGGFLEQIALMSDVDQLRQESRLVTLMTIHAAKGLEFDWVSVTGLEEGIFPHHRAVIAEEAGEDAPIEEERRLMYVAMTRAREGLSLSYARQRTFQGSPRYQSPSRFLEEIEQHLPAVSTLPLELSPATATPPAGLSEGERVWHPRWGEGRIEQLIGNEKRPIAIVLFTQGKRILDLRSAELSRLS